MIEVRLCADCVYANANGVDPSMTDWPGFLPEWAGFVFGPVLTGDDNEPSEGHFVRPGVSCDGCGSTFGGDRWDYVAVSVGEFDRAEREDAQ